MEAPSSGKHPGCFRKGFSIHGNISWDLCKDKCSLLQYVAHTGKKSEKVITNIVDTRNKCN